MTPEWLEAMKRQGILILGAGGHGQVVARVLKAQGREIAGFLDPVVTGEVMGIPVLGTDTYLNGLSSKVLANGVGSTQSCEARYRVFESFFRTHPFQQVIDEKATISFWALLNHGVQIMAGAVIQGGVNLGENVLINSGAIIEHDCVIGSHTHIASGAVLCGGVVVGEKCHVGAGARVIQGVKIGAGALIGAGAVVLWDVPDGGRVCGVPAKAMAA